MTAQKQLTFIEDERLEWADLTLDIDDELLPTDGQLIGDDPDSGMVDLVKRYGVLQRISLRQRTAGGPYEILDGNRRLKAARKALEYTIPAQVVVTDEPTAYLIGLMFNGARSENPIADLDKIRKLEQQGITDDRLIARYTHLAPAQIKKRRELGMLHPELREALRRGKIKTSVAEAAAKLTLARQAECATILADEGKLTLKQVELTKKVQTQDNLALLPDTLFGDTDWKSRTRARLLEARDSLPLGSPLAAKVEAVLDELDR
jgi:ParB-like chromosome segregation protein Spo0J